MARTNNEYLHGYRMGWEYAECGGNTHTMVREILSRGISMRTTYAVAFMNAVKDYKAGRPKKYD